MSEKNPVFIVTDKARMSECEQLPIPGEEIIAVQPSHAMSALTGMSADLLLLDCDNVTGLELLRIIKRRHSSLPVVFITLDGSEDLATQVFRAGARDYHRRPINNDSFYKSLSKILEVKRSSRGRRNFVSLLADAPKENPLPASQTYPDFINTVISHIQKNVTFKLNLDDLADVADMSKYHFSRAFKDITGMSPMRFVKYMKIQVAKSLLGLSSNSVTRIAEEVGFDDVSSFIRCFKSFEGIPPAAFRAESRRQ